MNEVVVLENLQRRLQIEILETTIANIEKDIETRKGAIRLLRNAVSNLKRGDDEK